MNGKKYHVSKDGKPRPCRANKRPCTLGEHYDSIESAFESLSSDQSPLKSMTAERRERERLYDKLSELYANFRSEDDLESKLKEEGFTVEQWDTKKNYRFEVVTESEGHTFVLTGYDSWSVTHLDQIEPVVRDVSKVPNYKSKKFTTASEHRKAIELIERCEKNGVVGSWEFDDGKIERWNATDMDLDDGLVVRRLAPDDETSVLDEPKVHVENAPSFVNLNDEYQNARRWTEGVLVADTKKGYGALFTFTHESEGWYSGSEIFFGDGRIATDGAAVDEPLFLTIDGTKDVEYWKKVDL